MRQTKKYSNLWFMTLGLRKSTRSWSRASPRSLLVVFTKFSEVCHQSFWGITFKHSLSVPHGSVFHTFIGLLNLWIYPQCHSWLLNCPPPTWSECEMGPEMIHLLPCYFSPWMDIWWQCQSMCTELFPSKVARTKVIVCKSWPGGVGEEGREPSLVLPPYL